jgi:hypothetical protein
MFGGDSSIRHRYDLLLFIRQLATLNDRYSTTNFQFDLAGFERIVNSTFAIGETEAIQNTMKRLYHKGTYTSLNLYFLSDWVPIELNGLPLVNMTLLGSCTFLKEINTVDDVKLDGCIMQQDSVPGNTVEPKYQPRAHDNS